MGGSEHELDIELTIAVLIGAVIFLTTVYLLIHNSIHTKIPDNTSWQSFVLNANDSRYQALSTINSSNVGHLKRAWTIKTGSYVTSTPVVANGTVYFADWGGNVYSANLSTGTLNWKVNLGSSISSTPAVIGNIIYVGVGPQQATEIFALSKKDGTAIWKASLNGTMKGIWASPVIYQGTVYIGTAASVQQGGENDSSEVGKLYALNANTGGLIWSVPTGGTAGGAAIWGSITFDPQLNQIYFGTGNPFSLNGTVGYSYSVVALDAGTGSPKWSYQAFNSLKTGDDKDFGSTPNLFDFSLNGVIHKAVGIGSKEGIYYVLDRQSGALLENVTLVNNGGIIGVAGYSYPSNDITNPEIFIPTYANGHPDFTNTSICCGALDAFVPSANNFAWKFKTLGNIVGSVAVIPGAVLTGDIKGNLYALSVRNGSVLWQTSLPAPILGGVSVAGGYVLVPTSFNNDTSTIGVYAFSE